VKKFAAVGDSYTAGIGAGSLVDAACSRYSGSYAVMMASQFESLSVFTFEACSAAQSTDIMTQIQGMPSNLDLAVMTAGGNDLCLAAREPRFLAPGAFFGIKD
jgi:mevalonate kinase